MRGLFYIIIIIAFSSCVDGAVEERWKDEIEYSHFTSKESSQLINGFFQDEESRNIESFRKQVLMFPFDEISEEAIAIEERFKHSNGICDSVLLELDRLDLDKDFNYTEIRTKVELMRDSLVQFMASYTDDKSIIYSFDASEMNENEEIAKQLRYSSQKINASDTALITDIYEILSMPFEMQYEESENELSILQKQMIMNSVISAINNTRSECLNSILRRFYYPGGFRFNKVIAYGISSKQVFGINDSLSLKVRMCVVDSFLRKENYFIINNKTQSFSENHLSIETEEKGLQTISGTLGVAEKGFLIQKPWSYQYYKK